MSGTWLLLLGPRRAPIYPLMGFGNSFTLTTADHGNWGARDRKFSDLLVGLNVGRWHVPKWATVTGEAGDKVPWQNLVGNKVKTGIILRSHTCLSEHQVLWGFYCVENWTHYLKWGYQ
jgi:hypothetical protein